MYYRGLNMHTSHLQHSFTLFPSLVTLYILLQKKIQSTPSLQAKITIVTMTDAQSDMRPDRVWSYQMDDILAG